MATLAPEVAELVARMQLARAFAQLGCAIDSITREPGAPRVKDRARLRLADVVEPLVAALTDLALAQGAVTPADLGDDEQQQAEDERPDDDEPTCAADVAALPDPEEEAA